MKTIKTIFFFALIAISVASGYLIGQQNNSAVSAQKQPVKLSKIPVKEPKMLDLIGKIQAEKIREIKIWKDADENEFYSVIRAAQEPPTGDSVFDTGEKLNIYDKSGKTIYEYKDVELGSVGFGRFLKSDAAEITFTANGGGTDDFLKILSYKNGKFTEIIDSDNSQFRGGYFTMPQYRTGNRTPYFNPSQLIVIQQQGGADENPKASILRIKDNKFQKVGEIKMRELGDFIESQMAQKDKAPE